MGCKTVLQSEPTAISCSLRALSRVDNLTELNGLAERGKSVRGRDLLSLQMAVISEVIKKKLQISGCLTDESMSYCRQQF